jgi:hypothetical protein
VTSARRHCRGDAGGRDDGRGRIRSSPSSSARIRHGPVLTHPLIRVSSRAARRRSEAGLACRPVDAGSLRFAGARARKRCRTPLHRARLRQTRDLRRTRFEDLPQQAGLRCSRLGWT